MVIKYCYFSVSKHPEGHFIHEYGLKKDSRNLYWWFNQYNAASLHRGTFIIEIAYYVSLSHFGLKQNSSIFITDAQHKSISITDAQHSSIFITDAQHSSISITDAQHSSISITDAQHKSISITDAQHSSISITDAQHSSISITDAQHSSISITDAQHKSISITDALGILLYNTFNHWFNLRKTAYRNDLVMIRVSWKFTSESESRFQIP